jgi:23S rRNA (uridine2552-2'-O)-methyltransferase
VSRRKRPYAGADPRTLRARALGYPARSVFKLEEIDRRVGLLRGGQHVLDLGAAPGSWSLYASQRVGPQGRVVAIDQSPIEQQFAPNVRVLRGDALAPDAEFLRLGPYDVVLSDMAPSTTGSKVRDQTQSFELFSGAVRIAAACGRAGSSFVGKLFMSPDFAEARAALAAQYERVSVIRPTGTRSQSSEVFLVGVRRRG